MYQSLTSEGQVRLVQLQPGNWEDDIQCRLVSHDLKYLSQTKTRYKSLSYVWGSNRVTEKIMVDGQELAITLNLACALRHLRSPSAAETLWVDAICINQKDPSERTHQVGIMRDIYGNADEVLVYLGDAQGHRVKQAYLKHQPAPAITFWNDGRDSSTLDMFRQSWKKLLFKQDWAAFCTVAFIRCMDDEPRQTIVKDICCAGEHFQTRLFELLRSFITLPWWQRIWVVQEITVASKTSVKYGNITAPWRLFVQASGANMYVDYEPEYAKVILMFNRLVREIERLRKSWDESKGSSLADLLPEFSGRQASDDRDKVYALLGLANDAEDIQADYSVAVAEVYRRTVLCLIRDSGTLTAWSGDRQQKHRQGLPSWIPDWSARIEQADRERMGLHKVYRACGSWKVAALDSNMAYWQHVAAQLEGLCRYLQHARDEHHTAWLLPWHLSTPLYAFRKYISAWALFEQGNDLSEVLSKICDSCETLEQDFVTPSYATPSQEYVSVLERRVLDGDVFFGTGAMVQTHEYPVWRTIPGPEDIWTRASALMNKEKVEGTIKGMGFLKPFYLACVRTQPQTQDLLLLPTASIMVGLVGDEGCGNRLITWNDRTSSWLTIQEWAARAAPALRADQTLPGEGDESVSWSLARRQVIRFLRVLVGDSMIEGTDVRLLRPTDHKLLSHCFARYVSSQIQAGMDWPNWSLWLKALDLEGGEAQNDDDDTWTSNAFGQQIRLATESRMFFETEHGIGLGPASMRAGDTVHILPGGRTHFVLRQTGVEPVSGDFIYDIIGDCFFLDFDADAQEGQAMPKILGSLPREVLHLWRRLGSKASIGQKRPIFLS